MRNCWQTAQLRRTLLQHKRKYQGNGSAHCPDTVSLPRSMHVQHGANCDMRNKPALHWKTPVEKWTHILKWLLSAVFYVRHCKPHKGGKYKVTMIVAYNTWTVTVLSTDIPSTSNAYHLEEASRSILNHWQYLWRLPRRQGRAVYDWHWMQLAKAETIWLRSSMPQ